MWNIEKIHICKLTQDFDGLKFICALFYNKSKQIKKISWMFEYYFQRSENYFTTIFQIISI